MSLWRTILLAINLVGARFGGAAIALASQILLARLLTQTDVGVVFMGMSAAAFISLLITGGYPTLAITCLPRYYALGRKNLVSRLPRRIFARWPVDFAHHLCTCRSGLSLVAVKRRN